MSAVSRSTLVTLAAAAFLLSGLALLALRASHDIFDADEFQHAHLAWLVAGGKLLYVDIWDNHGPLFSLVNGALLALSGAGPGLHLIFWCRAGAVLAAAGMTGLTALLARQAGLSRPTALTAAAILSLLVFFQDKAAECRPDAWQNLFWLAGIACLLAHLGRPRARLALAAGACMGLAVLTNVKAGLGPLVLGVFYLLGGRLHRVPPAGVARDLALLLAGGLAVYAVAVGYFFARGAAFELHDYSTWWNLLAARRNDIRGLNRANIAFMLERQAPFVLLAGWGAVTWVRDLRIAGGTLTRPAAWFLVAAAAGTGLGIGLNLYSQFFLFFLPLWSVIAAFGLDRCCGWLARLGGPGRWAAAAGAIAAGVALLAVAVRITPLAEHPALRLQRSFTALMLQITPRSEPLGVIYGDCGGYMFNEPLQFYWGAEAAIGETAKRHGGVDPFGEPFVREMERRRVRFVVGGDDFLLDRLPAEMQRYLRENFSYSNCLWKRKRGGGGESQ